MSDAPVVGLTPTTRVLHRIVTNSNGQYPVTACGQEYASVTWFMDDPNLPDIEKCQACCRIADAPPVPGNDALCLSDQLQNAIQSAQVLEARCERLQSCQALLTTMTDQRDVARQDANLWHGRHDALVAVMADVRVALHVPDGKNVVEYARESEYAREAWQWLERTRKGNLWVHWNGQRFLLVSDTHVDAHPTFLGAIRLWMDREGERP